MAVAAVLGAQWGDEGKGKIVDLLAQDMSLVIRFQGGANAGHTVYLAGQKVVLHQIPSGILHECCLNIIGNGCVVDAPALIAEMQQLDNAGFSIDSTRLMISDRAHLVTPLHRWLDTRSGVDIGTTGRGIGPCYEDKFARRGIRLLDFRNSEWDQVLHNHHERIRIMADSCGFGLPPEPSQWIPRFNESIQQISSLSGDTAQIIESMHKRGKPVLLEGAQGTMLDIDHGTYPYVTSSSCSIGGAFTGTGVFLPLDFRIGIFKAYATRVGSGPFTTEQDNEIGKHLRETGQEYGATTGRDRRCGWLDIPLLKLSCRINGFNRMVITKLDCLSEFEVIRAAISTDKQGNPVYKDFEGWNCSLSTCMSRTDLPEKCQLYLDFIESEIDVPLAAISIGPERHQIILEKSLWP